MEDQIHNEVVVVEAEVVMTDQSGQLSMRRPRDQLLKEIGMRNQREEGQLLMKTPGNGDTKMKKDLPTSQEL